MADTVSVDWIYPPKFEDGSWDEKSGNKRVIVRLRGTSDGTGENQVVKIDLDDLKTVDGNVPSRTAVEYLKWNISGTSCVLEWDRAPREEIATLTTGQDEMFWPAGGYVDPGGDDRTGDILLTTSMANGKTYDITMMIRLKD